MYQQIVARMLRAVQLDVGLYNEVEADENATTEAVIVVVLAAVAAAIGTALSGHGHLVSGIFGSIIAMLIGWIISSATIYFVGTRFFGGTATIGELLRTLGYATSPGVLNILSFIPVLGSIIGFAVSIWLLVTTVVAAREALDVDTTKAILTCIIAFVIWGLITALIATVFGVALAGVGVMMGAFR